MCSIIGYLGTSISAQDLRAGFDKTVSRGPDDTRMLHIGAATLGFHRLAIMGLHPEGMQPFTRDGSALVCNGEIYGFRPIREQLIAEGETFESESDCEILLPLYEREGLDMFRGLDAEFAMIIYDAKRGSLVAARDPIGIRPLYYGYDAEGAIIFASEAKNLVGLVHDVLPFPPGHYYADGKFTCYRDMTHVDAVCTDDLETVCTNIREKLIAGVQKRLDADAPLGFLLSGGLDSSLVDANGKFKTFRCRRLVETSDDEFADWGDYNDSSLRLVTVDMTYESDVSYSKDEGVDTLSFYLDRGEIDESNELQPPVTTNYFYSGENVSAQNSRSVTFASPVYAEIDGQKADLVDVGITMNRDGEKHDLKVYFLVDESEIEDSYMSISNDDGYSQKYDYISVYLGEGK